MNYSKLKDFTALSEAFDRQEPPTERGSEYEETGAEELYCKECDERYWRESNGHEDQYLCESCFDEIFTVNFMFEGINCTTKKVLGYGENSPGAHLDCNYGRLIFSQGGFYTVQTLDGQREEYEGFSIERTNV